MSPALARRALLGLLAVVLLLTLAGCGGSQAPTLVTYQREWPDGFHEELTLQGDGKLTMRHGDTLERLTLTADQVQQVRDALGAGLAMGDQGDSLVRTVILPDGSVHTPVRPEAGSVVEMLEVLLTTHTLGGIQAEGVTPPPLRSIAP